MQGEDLPKQPFTAPPKVDSSSAPAQVPSEGATQEISATPTTALPPESGSEQESQRESWPAPPPLLFQAEKRLDLDIADSLAGKLSDLGVPKERLFELCRVIDYWLDNESGALIEGLGLISLAEEIKKDYVTSSFLAWRGEFKIAYVTLRSFLESFCLLLYYLNQGCDRLLFLRGKGYKLMLHRMAQKRSVPDDMHAFRRHYHLLIEDSYGSAKAADKFFDEIDDCYGILSKAVHGDYSAGTQQSTGDLYVATTSRVLRICNTLALHEPILEVTEDLLEEALGGVLKPLSFEWKK